jgi:hypothetical protein
MNMAQKVRICAVWCSVESLVWPALVGAQDIDAKSFRCIRQMTPVRQFYVDNLRGNLAGALAAANASAGAVYPPGSVVQLIPGEAMVKRDPGFSAASHDWEFFALDVSKDGTRIGQRGTTNVANALGTCLGCHAQAQPRWDLVCENTHGCAPLKVTDAMIRALQRTDPRCENPPISPEDAEALKQLQQLSK